jgi:hypothetical protein
MGRQHQSVSAEELADISRQCAALHEDWHRFYQLASAAPGSDAVQRQLAFIQLQSRFSCDYPILSRWRAGNFGLASAMGKLVARAGTLEAFAREAQQGDGPLVRDWNEVNDAIVKVRSLLEGAREQARKGGSIALPKELSVPVAREPWPVEAWMRKGRIAGAALLVCAVAFLIARPYLMETSLLRWVDKSYTAWQLRNGLPATQAPVQSVSNR